MLIYLVAGCCILFVLLSYESVGHWRCGNLFIMIWSQGEIQFSRAPGAVMSVDDAFSVRMAWTTPRINLKIETTMMGIPGAPRLGTRVFKHITFAAWPYLAFSLVLIVVTRGARHVRLLRRQGWIYERWAPWWLAVVGGLVGCVLVFFPLTTVTICTALVIFEGFLGLSISADTPLLMLGIIDLLCLLGLGGLVTYHLRWRLVPPPFQSCACGYNLTGNTSGRCPECGTAITV